MRARFEVQEAPNHAQSLARSGRMANRTGGFVGALFLVTGCATFKKPYCEHRCNLLILKNDNCRADASEYICLSNFD